MKLSYNEKRNYFSGLQNNRTHKQPKNVLLKIIGNFKNRDQTGSCTDVQIGPFCKEAALRKRYEGTFINVCTYRHAE